jgi:glycerol uptake facilitator protein
MHSEFLGEFLGTMMLVLLGDGVVAGVLLKGSKANASGWIVITAGWAVAVLCGIFVCQACGGPSAHLNPAVTIGLAIISSDYSKLATYIPAQMLGAILGAILVWLMYLPHWAETEEQDSKLACFCTAPAIRKPAANLLAEAIATFVLIFTVWAIFSKGVSPTGLTPGIGPALVAALVWGIGMSLGGPTGYAINPARDLGPRIAHAILPIAGKGGSDWGYSWIPVLGPCLGAIAAGLLVLGLRL